MIAQANIERILHRYAELEAKMADGGASFAKLAKEYSDLGRRYARFAMIIRDGVVDQLFVQDASGVTVSGAPAILLALQGRAAA